jgi:hypothetical protein
MSYEDALLRVTQKPPHPDSNWSAIRFSSGNLSPPMFATNKSRQSPVITASPIRV